MTEEEHRRLQVLYDSIAKNWLTDYNSEFDDLFTREIKEDLEVGCIHGFTEFDDFLHDSMLNEPDETGLQVLPGIMYASQSGGGTVSVAGALLVTNKRVMALNYETGEMDYFYHTDVNYSKPGEWLFLDVSGLPYRLILPAPSAFALIIGYFKNHEPDKHLVIKDEGVIFYCHESSSIIEELSEEH